MLYHISQYINLHELAFLCALIIFLTYKELRKKRAKNGYEIKSIKYNEKITVHFWDCYRQKGPDCAMHSLSNIICVYAHLSSLFNPTLKDIFETKFIEQKKLETFISDYRKKHALRSDDGLPWHHFSTFISNLGSQSLFIKKTADLIKKDSYVVENMDTCCFIPKQDHHPEEFYQLSDTQFITNNELQRKIYQKIHSGKITIVQWATKQVFPADTEKAGHAICNIFVPTLDRNFNLEKVDLITLDSSMATYKTRLEDPEKDLLAKTDHINFLEGIFKHRPLVSEKITFH